MHKVMFIAVLALIAPLERGQTADKPPVADMPPPGNTPDIVTLGTTAQNRIPAPKAGNPEDPAPRPLADSGRTDRFSYRRSAEFEGVYEVRASDAASDSDISLVSEHFLGLILNNRSLDDEHRLVALYDYPNMVLGHYARTMNGAYPDSTKTFDKPFAEQTVGTPAGPHAVVTQDEMAGPYVRVKLTDEDSTTTEFSMARMYVERLLNNPMIPESEKIRAIANMGMRLPEELRRPFPGMGAAELWEKIAERPELQRLEFVRMRNVFRQVGARGGQAATNAAGPAYFVARRRTLPQGSEGGSVTLPPPAATATSDVVRVVVPRAKPAATARATRRPAAAVLGLTAGAVVVIAAVLLLRRRS